MSTKARYRITMAVTIACVGCLAAVALAPGLRHHLPANGVFVVIAAVTGIAGSLVYLHSTRRQP